MESTVKKSSNDITSKTIIFKADDKKYCYETNKANVTVIGSTGKHDHGSSKVKLKNIVDYKWEVRNFPGRLIAVHIDGKHIAYAIMVNNKEAGTEGMVRVVNPTSGHRALIKGMTSEVLDLQFAHLKRQILLGCIEAGALHIHQIDNHGDKIVCTLLLKIEDSTNGVLAPTNKISWCPYVPENEMEIDEYSSQQLVWIRGNTYQCYSIRSVINMYGAGSRLQANSIEGTLKHKEMSNITGATFSPDGTTLCVSCEDGVIRFYQVYFHTNETNPRCLHQWIPHGGKPITSFFFLDNHTLNSTDKSLWRHAITTTDNNTEIKVWCCSTWDCTQTINFKSQTPAKELLFHAEIDRTSSYLVLSDMKNRGLYVLQIQKNAGSTLNSDAMLAKRLNNTLAKSADVLAAATAMTNSGISNSGGVVSETTLDDNEVNKETKSFAYVKSISEFPLSSPILSFGIFDAAVRKYKCAFNDSYLIDELDDYDEDNHLLYCVVIHMFLVQPKSVQECHVLYQPTISESAEVGSSIGDDNNGELDAPFDVANDTAVVLDQPMSLEECGALNERALTPELIVENNVSVPTLATSPKVIKPENNVIHPNLGLPPPPIAAKPAGSINLMTPDSFNSPGKITPEGVSMDVLSTLYMLAKVQSPPDAKHKTAENTNLLNLINNKVIEEQEHMKTRQSVELSSQIMAAALPIAAPTLSATAASGGSSPSREVQEILSLKDSDCLNEFYDDPSDLLDDNDIESLDNKKMTEESYNFNETCSKDGNNETTKVSSLTANNKSDWPQVPLVPAMSNIHCSNFNNIGTANTTFNDIGYKMDQILEFMQTQTCQISELRGVVDFVELQKNKGEDTVKLDKLAKNIEFNLSKLIEEYMVRFERDHTKRLDMFLAARDAQNRDLRDNIVHSVAQVVCNQITERQTAMLLTEMKRNVMPMIAGKLDTLKAQIQADVTHKLSACDQLLRDTIVKVCSSKTSMDTFGAAVVMGVQTGLQNTYVDAMKNILVPAYEKSSEDMFKQIQETFFNGLTAYMKQLDQSKVNNDEITRLLQTLPAQLKAANDSAVSSCTSQMNHDIQRDLKAMQVNLLKNIRDNVKNEIQKGFESQAATIEDSVMQVVRSQAQTPAPSIFDVQEQIKNLLTQGQINSAFHQALVANDLNLVEFTLEKADYKAVFNPCPLQQTVLLSLIQQISADMSNHNELKQKYLADAILNLNLRDPTTKEHAPKVMRELMKHCQNFTVANPNSAHCSGLRMVMMATQGLGIKLY